MSPGSRVLSIREISRRTDVPESTLRYYRSLFPEYIPTVGSGRQRRHPEQAVAVYQRISRLFAAGESRARVRRELEGGARERETAADEPPVQVRRGHEIELAQPEDRLQPRELEHLLTAMMVRDRELVAMHRELLELLERLLHSLGSLAGARAPGWNDASRREPAIPPPTEAGVTEPAVESSSVELERLRESLQRERETVERLRRARLELEQRLARLEKEGGGR